MVFGRLFVAGGALCCILVATGPGHCFVSATDEGTGGSLDDTCVANGDNECQAEGAVGKEDNDERRATADARGSQECGVWLAESTIPGAGLGVYTGKDLESGAVLDYPEIAIPLVDMPFHNGWEDEEYGPFWNYWMNYVHNAGDVGMDHEGRDLEVFVPGIGAIPACHYALNNNEEMLPTYDATGLHRSNDPGAGAFSGWYNRWARTTKSVPARAELFADYGRQWFEERTEQIGFLPFPENYQEADRFLISYRDFLRRRKDMMTDALKNDLWEGMRSLPPDGRRMAMFEGIFQKHGVTVTDDLKKGLKRITRALPFKPRTKNALHLTSEEADHAMEVGIEKYLLPTSMRSLDWFEKNGKCMDNIKPGNSTIPQAGRGAFATRIIPKGAIVAPAPLLHIPDRTMLNMYAEMEGADGEMVRDTSKLIGYQILLNYCFGHRHSSMLLCPYGSTTGYINHNSVSPNAKIVWAEDSPNHDAECLKKSPEEIEQSIWRSCTSFDFVATRDIHPGEEVFLDYGTEWEEAWNGHVRDWKPVEGSESYVRAVDLSRDLSTPIKTEEEQENDPYPQNMHVVCDHRRDPPSDQWRWNRDLDGDINGLTSPCRILSRDIIDGEELYSAEILVDEDDDDEEDDEEDEENPIITHMPREGIYLVESEYSNDEFLPNAFRHEIMIPDEMFPEAWIKND